MNQRYFYCPFMGYLPYRNMYRFPNANSYVRVFHGSPDAPAVDIYVNNNKTVSNLRYREFSDYLPLQPGSYNIKIYPAGRRENPVINTEVRVPRNSILTLAAVDELENISLLPINDMPMMTEEGKAYVKFVHLSPNAPAVDIRLPDGTTLFRNVEFKEITNYIPVNPGTITLEVFVAGTNNRVLYVPNIQLKGNNIYSVYAVGLVGEEPPLQVLIPLDGSTYINV